MSSARCGVQSEDRRCQFPVLEFAQLSRVQHPTATESGDEDCPLWMREHHMQIRIRSVSTIFRLRLTTPSRLLPALLFCLVSAPSIVGAANWTDLISPRLEAWEPLGDGIWRVTEDGILIGYRRPAIDALFGASETISRQQFEDWLGVQSWLYTGGSTASLTCMSSTGLACPAIAESRSATPRARSSP